MNDKDFVRYCYYKFCKYWDDCHDGEAFEGMMPPHFDEFVDNEFADEDIMADILNDKEYARYCMVLNNL